MKDFQAFTVKYSGRTNTLFSDVGVSVAFNPEIEISSQTQIHTTKAIWDTGATCTVVTKQFAQQINLIPTGRTTITGVNHVTEENTYLVNVYLPNKVCIAFIKVVEVPALSSNAGMLIGMDIIGAGDFSIYTENDHTVMTYRFPSIGGVDFVVEAGNIRSNRRISEMLEKQKSTRKQIVKNKQQRKQERKNRQKGRKNR